MDVTALVNTLTSKLAASVFMLAVYAVALSATQDALRETGTITGILTRAGTSEPLANVQVTLEGGVVDPKVIQLILNSAATAGIVLTPPPGASLSEITRLMA